MYPLRKKISHVRTFVYHTSSPCLNLIILNIFYPFGSIIYIWISLLNVFFEAYSSPIFPFVIIWWSNGVYNTCSTLNKLFLTLVWNKGCCERSTLCCSLPPLILKRSRKNGEIFLINIKINKYCDLIHRILIQTLYMYHRIGFTWHVI